jgi:glycosyltransferase involved in cell wall biosynthesis
VSGPLRIAQVVPPLERVPPTAYGGTERVVHELLLELERRGYELTTFASGDSDVPGRLIPTVPRALRPAGFGGDPTGWYVGTQLAVLDHQDEFDVIHSHLELPSLVLARASRVPVLSTFHGRLDTPVARAALAGRPTGLVAISRSHAGSHPEVPWEGVVYNGLTLERLPFERRRGDHLVFVGRVAPEKGIIDAIDVARLSGRKLHIAAKVGPRPKEIDYFESVFKPALKRADIEFHGEIEADERDRLVSSAYASLLPGNWPEPFGLVAIESLACGAPIIARRVGAMPEIIRDGVDGFFGDVAINMAYLLDRVEDLDRDAIRQSVIERFSAARMTDGYERLYRRLLDDRSEAAGPEEPAAARDHQRVAERLAVNGNGHGQHGPVATLGSLAGSDG